MKLNEKQIIEANDLIKQYKFPTLQTQKELQELGFFNLIKPNMCLLVHKELKTEILQGTGGKSVSACTMELSESKRQYNHVIPMVQFEDIWKLIPNEIHIALNLHIKVMAGNKIFYGRAGDGNVEFEEIVSHNFCESACKLWIRLKREEYI